MTQSKKSCGVCRIGRCQPAKVPYLYWVDDQVMVMPDSPALICDVCGQVQFESAFLVRIERLLQELESSIEQRKSTKVPMPVDDPVKWHPSRGR
ncbi:MAG: hypothetical protein CSA11_05115 [Chloroflexi bacterium]|nr:MAG: hypothetical protein CSB13_12075 [Chloroflexota bacterium]PIE81156.1 MAG: hypothetical protein CSA11_05115 [Chloroflexota bacterium]